MKLLKNVELDTDESFREVFRIVKNDIVKWQENYELIRKNREIASDIEFSNTRHFAAKVYENVIRVFYKAILENISALRKNLDILMVHYLIHIFKLLKQLLLILNNK